MTGSVEEDDREDEEVLLVPQDARWFSIYEHEAARLHTALSPHGLVGIEHVGSTAIPGIVAKPIVDIVAGVGDVRDLPRYDDHFWLDLGYRWRGEQKDDWLYFVKRAPDGKRIAQLHVTPHDETFWNDIIVFRDALHADAKAAIDYANLKVELAEKYHNDRLGYRDGKAVFVARVIADNSQC